MISEDEENEIIRLLALKNATYGDKQSALNLVKKFINEGYNCCMTCDPQIRKMFSILREWWSGQTKG